MLQLFVFYPLFLYCSLFSLIWSWILSILTLAFLIAMPLMIELLLKALKLHSSMCSNFCLGGFFAHLHSWDYVSFYCSYQFSWFFFISLTSSHLRSRISCFFPMIIVKIKITILLKGKSTPIFFISCPKIGFNVKSWLFTHLDFDKTIRLSR